MLCAVKTGWQSQHEFIAAMEEFLVSKLNFLLDTALDRLYLDTVNVYGTGLAPKLCPEVAIESFLIR